MAEQKRVVQPTETGKLLPKDDAVAALDLVARIRQALGDNGKRMQDELIEYCKELVRAKERLDGLGH